MPFVFVMLRWVMDGDGGILRPPAETGVFAVYTFFFQKWAFSDIRTGRILCKVADYSAPQGTYVAFALHIFFAIALLSRECFQQVACFDSFIDVVYSVCLSIFQLLRVRNSIPTV